MKTSTTIEERKPALPTWARIILFIIAFIISTGIFQILGLLIAKISVADIGKISEMGTSKLMILQISALLPLLILVFVFRKFIDRKSILSLGFSTKKRGVDFGVGFVMAVLIIGGGSVILRLIGVVKFSVLELNSKELVLSFLLFIVVALNEEIMMRGYILNNLLSAMNKYLALIISAVLFTAMHGFNSSLSWIALTNLFLAGIVLGAAYIFTQNLWFPISLHLFWNFFQGPVLGYHVSGQEVDSLFAVQLSGNEMLNGGGFGFEGSLVCTGMTLLMTGIILYYYLKKTPKLNFSSEVNSVE